MDRLDEYTCSLSSQEGQATGPATGGESAGLLGWLQVARQQSQALAELRAAHQVPFAWGRRRARRASRRPLWLTATLAAGVLGLATVTLATLHARRAASPSPAAPLQPVGSGTVHGVEPGPPRPAAPPALRAAPSQQPAVPAPVRRRMRSAVPAAAAERPAANARSEKPPEKVIFEGDEPGDSVIIVAPPPRRLGPLFTPEGYKKQRAGHQPW